MTCQHCVMVAFERYANYLCSQQPFVQIHTIYGVCRRGDVLVCTSSPPCDVIKGNENAKPATADTLTYTCPPPTNQVKETRRYRHAELVSTRKRHGVPKTMISNVDMKVFVSSEAEFLPENCHWSHETASFLELLLAPFCVNRRRILLSHRFRWLQDKVGPAVVRLRRR